MTSGGGGHARLFLRSSETSHEPLTINSNLTTMTKSYDATNRGSETTRCGNCGRLIRAHASDTEKVSIPLRFLLYPIPIISYSLMSGIAKRFCCLTCKDQFMERHPNAWKRTFWLVHGTLILVPLIFVPFIFLMADKVNSETDKQDTSKVEKVENVNSTETKDEKSSNKSEDTKN